MSGLGAYPSHGVISFSKKDKGVLNDNSGKQAVIGKAPRSIPVVGIETLLYVNMSLGV